MVLRSYKLTNRKLAVVSLLALLLVCLFHGGKANALATNGYSITLTPSAAQLSAAPGGRVNSNFTVVNEGTSDYTLRVSTAPYRVVGINYNPQFNTLPGKVDPSKWLTLDAPASQNLGPNKTQTINYALNVPVGTAPGGYYAVIFAEAVPPPSATRGVTAINRVGDVVYITVEGPVTKTGDVKAASLPFVSLSSSMSIGTLVQDTGGVHFLTNVNETATSLFGGHQAFQASLQRYVLPQTERLVTAYWSNMPAFGIYKINRSATIFGQTRELPTHWVVIIKPWLLITIIALLAIIVFVTILLPSSKTVGKSKKAKKKINVRN